MLSTRLPGKVAELIAGKSLLTRVIERAQAATLVDEVVVAIADEPGHETLVGIAAASGAHVFVGDTQDVLDRTYRAALAVGADRVVRITSDDPFKDPAIIDLVVEPLLDDAGLDYTSNALEPTFPEGLDVEAIEMRALEIAWSEAALPVRTRTRDAIHLDAARSLSTSRHSQSRRSVTPSMDDRLPRRSDVRTRGL